MRRAFSFVLIAIVQLACTQPLATLDDDLFSGTRVMTGDYRYIDGDRFIYSCGGSTCVDTLVRDSFLEANAVQLNGSRITIEVRRVIACDMQLSSQVACVRSSDGSALKIRRWIRPKSI